MFIKIKVLEEKLEVELKRNITILAIDSASTTGICYLDINSTNVHFKTHVIKFGEHKRGESLNNKFDVGIDTIDRFIVDNMKTITDIVVIEKPFDGMNKYGFGLLSSLMAIYYCKFKPLCKGVVLKFACQARKSIKFSTKKLKQRELKNWIKEYIADLGFGEVTHDEADAIILALSEAVVPAKQKSLEV
jgi:hypothetical protein